MPKQPHRSSKQHTVAILSRKIIATLLYLISLSLIFTFLELTLALSAAAPPPPDEIYSMAANDNTTIHHKNLTKYGINLNWPSQLSHLPQDLISEDKQTNIPPKKRAPRILIVGDSLVEGYSHTNLNHVWPEQLKNNLLADAYEVEVYKASKGGFSTYDQYLMLTQTDLLDIIQPDLVVMGLFENDLDPSIIEEGRQILHLTDDIFVHTGADACTLFLKEHLPILYAKINTAIIDKFSNQEKSWLSNYGHYTINRELLTTTENLNLVRNNTIAPLKSFLLSKQIPLVFATCEAIPSDHNQESFYKPLGEIFAELSIPYYNLAADLITEEKNYALSNDWQQKEFTISSFDNHPGPHSAQLCARKLQTALERDFPQLLPKNENPLDTSQIIINDYLPYELNVTQLNTNTYHFQYPYPDQQYGFVHWPLGLPYVQLNFQFPVDLKRVILTGNFENPQLWINKLNHEKSYLDSDGKLAIWNDQEFYPLTTMSYDRNSARPEKTTATFNINDIDITSLSIHLDTLVNDTPTPVTIEFVLDLPRAAD